MNKAKPHISVILCNYNYARFIGEAIESVLAQSYEDFELIIVDDGSIDNSREVISSFKDSRIKTIYQENKGQAGAFNTAFADARGELIAFLDSDDWWKSEKLSEIVRWDTFLNGEYALMQHALDVWDNGKSYPYKNVLPSGDCFAEMRKTGCIDFFIPTTGLVFRRSMLEKVFPVPEQFRISADAYIMRTIFIFGGIISIPTSLGYYRKHNNAVFANKNFKAYDFFNNELFPVLDRFYEANGIDYRTKPIGKSFIERAARFYQRWLKSK